MVKVTINRKEYRVKEMQFGEYAKMEEQGFSIIDAFRKKQLLLIAMGFTCVAADCDREEAERLITQHVLGGGNIVDIARYGSLYSGWTARGYKGYKTGGMPLNGEIYVANENGFGSEYIGNIGNRHVVANNSQIVESVSSGVERANDETNALLREVIEYQKAILRKNVSVNMDSKRVDKQISKARNNAGFSFSPT